MDYKKLITILGFTPKEHTTGIFTKKYSQFGGYYIDINFDSQSIDYSSIVSDSKTTQNFSRPENFVVLECVDRLLSKGYKPQNIILEKVWRSGHGTSGRLDICVTHSDGTPYMLIECKTAGKEFEKELSKTKKDGGQLFTYFQLSGGKADVIMLYTSELNGKSVSYRNEIIKIEDEYRSGEVKDIYEKWNKLTKDNGVFDSWVNPYNFQSKALTKEQLKEIRSEDSSFIFNRFLEILRHNVVSDKGNAFNKIFTLFLCKVYDETSKVDGEELDFQWKEGVDNHVDFQLRLTDLYSKGMEKFLERKVSDFSKEDFDKRCANLNEETKKYLLEEVNKLRLEKNNEFAVKEVYDSQSFEENAKVVKEVVELIQGYRIRYNKRQQYLSDFFELLLTTGLKQEAGQFFTPVPVAQFIIKSLPLQNIVKEKLNHKDGEILPYMIDYAAGSGHFITEYMHEVQNILNNRNPKDYIDSTCRKIKNWQEDHFDWATQYVYGIEKDYRLVKVGKVGCYLHGDGLANVILSDGLANFRLCGEYKLKLKKDIKDTSKDNQQFDVILSNPPYSVAAFRQTTRDYYTDQDFDLYNYLTDNSSEIECLFVERTKQLLKDGGVVGVILPSSILSNTGIYSRTREMILQYFDIVAIAELGSNTFMATGTNTVVLFMRRRNNYDAKNIRDAVNSYLTTLVDVTINGIENPVSKYVSHVWEGLRYSDYITLLQKSPNEMVKSHEIFVDYNKKIKDKNLLDNILAIESEKLFYFILTYKQQVVLVKSGEKDSEKRFLGYEFSNRRGSEGIHPIQRGRSIEECTQLFDAHGYDNPDKASTYINRAFNGDFESKIAESMQKNVSRARLVDMLTFDRVDFEKTISTSIKKKVVIESKWQCEKLSNIAYANPSKDEVKDLTAETEVSFVEMASVSNNGYVVNKVDKAIGEVLKGGYSYFKDQDIIIAKITPCMENGKCAIAQQLTNGIGFGSTEFHVIRAFSDKVNNKYLFHFLNQDFIRNAAESVMTGASGHRRVPIVFYEQLQIPLPPKGVQEKIVAEIERIERVSENAISAINKAKEEIRTLIEISSGRDVKIGEILTLEYGKALQESKRIKGEYPVMGSNGIVGYHNEYIVKAPAVIVGRKGSAGKVVWSEDNCFPIDTTFYVNLIDRTISLKLMYYILQSLNLQGGGTGVPGLNRNDVYEMRILIPSSEEQQRVVKKIEKLEAEIAKAQQLIDNAPQQKAVIMKKYLQ